MTETVVDKGRRYCVREGLTAHAKHIDPGQGWLVYVDDYPPIILDDGVFEVFFRRPKLPFHFLHLALKDGCKARRECWEQGKFLLLKDGAFVYEDGSPLVMTMDIHDSEDWELYTMDGKPR